MNELNLKTNEKNISVNKEMVHILMFLLIYSCHKSN